MHENDTPKTLQERGDSKHCVCKRCTQLSDPQQRRLHNLIRNLVGILDQLEIAACLAQLQRGELIDESDEELCQLGEVSQTHLEIGRQSAQNQLRSLEQKAAGISQRIATYAADSFTLTCLTSAVNLSEKNKRHIPQDEALSLSLTINSRKYKLLLPSFQAIYDLSEVLFFDTYQHVPLAVDSVYDLGAHIGISTLFLNSLYPSARFICVEPAAPNLSYLRRNLDDNSVLIEHTIVPAAVASSCEGMTLGLSLQPSMVNSGVFDLSFDQRLVVPTITLPQLIGRGPYGIKLDIEGGEFGLRRNSEQMANASWIVGELHYGAFSRPEDRWLKQLLCETFRLHLAMPRVDKHGGSYIVAQEFQASRT